MSGACHWAVNQAASDYGGKMWGRAYSILLSAIYVKADSTISRPEELAGVGISVDYHSGSRFSTNQALEAFVRPSEIELVFGGFPYARVDALLSGEVEAPTDYAPAVLV